MGKRKYKVRDSLALEHGVGTQQAKRGDIIDENTRVHNDDDREGLRDLDRMVEQSAGLSRAAKDNERVIPRDTTAPLGHPAKDRRLLEPDALRIPMSKRQRLERLHLEKSVVEEVSNARYQAVATLTEDRDTWKSLNGGLARNLGDVQALSKADQTRIQRVDRTIQAYEAGNDRGHRVYANVRLNRGINASNVEGFLDHNLEVGSTVYFDQYTAGSHNMHEIESKLKNGRDVVVEIHTRRGMFIGAPGNAQSNGHLLPRGMKLEVAGFNQVTYTRPDGTRGQRMCIQLLDNDAEPQEKP